MQQVSVSGFDTTMQTEFLLTIMKCTMTNLIQASVQKPFSVPYWNLEGIIFLLHAYCCSYISALINNLLRLWIFSEFEI